MDVVALVDFDDLTASSDEDRLVVAGTTLTVSVERGLRLIALKLVRAANPGETPSPITVASIVARLAALELGPRPIVTVSDPIVPSTPGSTLTLPWATTTRDLVDMRRGGVLQWLGPDFQIAGRLVTIPGGYDAGETFQFRRMTFAGS